MDLQKLIDKGEVAKFPTIDKCNLFTKEIVLKHGEDPVLMEKGPCARIAVDKTCCAYIDPTAKWRLGNCGLATHIIHEEDVSKFKLNPIKASKRT